MFSVIITNYNTWHLTMRCIQTLDKTAKGMIEKIIIVDDFSNTETPQEIINHSLVEVCFNDENLGYAKCVNKGFEIAESEICLLLDSDAYPISGLSLIENEFNTDEKLGVLGFKLVDENAGLTGREEKEANIWSLILGQKLNQKIGSIFNSVNTPITLHSCAIAIRKKAFEAVGGFDESFDFLDADHDFSMKINRSKFYIKTNDEIAVFHKGGGSPQLTSKRVIRMYTNRMKLLRKYDKIPAENLVKFLIKARLALEIIYFRTFGRYKLNKTIYCDKLESRYHLLRKLDEL